MLHNLHSSPSIVQIIKLRRTRWAGCVTFMVMMKNAYTILIRKSGKKKKKKKKKKHKPPRRPRSWWQDNIKTVLKEIMYRGVEWIQLAHFRRKRWALVNAKSEGNF
jgi:hypothetical protein